MTQLDQTHEQDDELIATINIIPFVDIVLVLLIIFMLTSSIIAKASFHVDLPKAASAGQGVDSILNIVLTKGGQVLLNGVPTSRQGIAEFTLHQARRIPRLQAVIAADQVSQYGEVIEIIDIVKQNGVTAFALNIERRPKPD